MGVHSEDDADHAALRAALIGVTPLPPSNRVELRKPRPVRRPAAEAPPAKTGKQRIEPELPAHWRQHEARVTSLADDPETAALQQAMRGVVPLPERNLASLEKPRPLPQARQQAAEEQAVLADKLGEIFEEHPDFAAYYPQPEWANACWVAQRWLEVLQIPAEEKLPLIVSEDCSDALRFLMQVVQSPLPLH